MLFFKIVYAPTQFFDIPSGRFEYATEQCSGQYSGHLRYLCNCVRQNKTIECTPFVVRAKHRRNFPIFLGQFRDRLVLRFLDAKAPANT